ncbi:MAG: hypothetical protein M0R80_08560 [Proteobacteria bacterium]|jgi:hypothetical protein|nr:hypothetical protein [Pseudomonadota bacterium]
MRFKTWLAEVGQTGGVGGGLTPPKENPMVAGPGALPQYNNGEDPPTGWSKLKRRLKKMKKN